MREFETDQESPRKRSDVVLSDPADPLVDDEPFREELTGGGERLAPLPPGPPQKT